MRKPKPLPLDDSRWMRLGAAHKLLYQRSGSTHFAALDLTDALAAGRVRCMRRSFKDGRRELVPAAFWTEHKLVYGFASGALSVTHRASQHQTDVEFIHSWKFVWAPDIEQCWPTSPTRAPGGGRKETFNLKQTKALQQEYRDFEKGHPDATKTAAKAHLKGYAEKRFLITVHEDTINDNVVRPVDQEK